MYLEKLKIFGFKSFAKQATFDFMPGITGIVGPNGCGKSNVVDAIRWVLGEQKAGILRSDRMENVIFNGSKTQKPMGMAEVSLVIQNTQNILPVEYSEVVITRRLFRSGESQYLLNNNSCRLKDINDLLMDTGLTPDAYSVIELSMVESILNGKPEDRRRIFEEAVGITKYKQRRKLTLKKLDATEQDMLRLSDIIGEVRSKVNSLHRQVRRAQRYQDLARNLKEIEIHVATHHYSQIYDQLVPLNASFEELTRKRESLTSQISFKEAEVESLQADLLQLEQQLRQMQTEYNQIANTIRQREEEILLSRERLKSLAENKVRIQSELEQLKQRILQHHERVNQIQQQLNDTGSEAEKIRQTYQQEKNLLDELERAITDARARGRIIEKQMFDHMQSLSEKQRLLERLNTQSDHIKDREIKLTTEKDELSRKLEQESQAKLQFHKAELQYQTRSDESLESQTELELESEQLTQQIEQLKNDILKNINQVDAATQRAAFLKELLESYADYPEGVKYLMKNFGAEKGFRNTFADVISVDEKYRIAIESALGDMAGYLVVKDDHAAYFGIDHLNDNQRGIVTFLPLQNLVQRQRRIATPDAAGVVGWADDFVRGDVDYLPAIRTLLGSFLIVSDLATASKLAPSFSGQDIHFVTLSGELIFNWGGMKGGKKEYESESLIGRQGNLQRLRQEIDARQNDLSRNEKWLKELEANREENSRRKSDAAKNVKLIQEQLSKTRMDLSQLDYRLHQIQERMELIDAEQIQLQQEHEQIGLQRQELEAELRIRSADRSALNDSIKGHQQTIDEHEANRNEQATKVNQLNLQIVELTGVERNFTREFEQTQKLIAEDDAAIKNREHDLIKIDEQRQHLESKIEELSDVLSTDYSTKDDAEQHVTNFEQKTRSLRDTIDEKSKITGQLRREREATAETIHQVELKKSELRINADNLYHRIFEEYDLELKREPLDASYDVTVNEKEIENLRQQIKSLGPVNLLALKEYEQEKERLDFLEKQQEDLISAEQNLKDTITQLNQTAQEKFDSVFLEIRENFVKVFKDFFPEGESDLVIVPDEDPLESTIEIKANPKGKKMESLMLLSGGEKSLTAISLLFAIYLVKPSPICILDEVDAPLDDNNVKRFLKTIRQFSTSTQFIVVTHNKLTMKSSDCLFGITMEESGVSKIVSVKLE